MDKRITTGLSLGNWVDQEVGGKWVWWSVPGESRIYHRNDNHWSYYRRALRRYHLDDETNTFPFGNVLPILVVPATANSVTIKGQTKKFILLPAVNALSDFEADSEWSTLSKGYDYVVNDPTILLGKFILPEDMCNGLVDGIREGTASIVLDGSFEPNSPIGMAGTSAVILTPSTICQPKYWVKGWNWVTGPEVS